VKNYYHILNVPESAHNSDIKSAFRRLAKTEHPDVNHKDGSKQKFIEILEAYQVLSNDESRNAYDLRRKHSKLRSEMLMKKEAEYREWFEKYQHHVRQEAKVASEQQFDDFVNSPLYRTAMVMNKVYDYIFIGIGIFMIFGPFILWHFSELPVEQRKPLWSMIFPSVLGISFTYGIYYFIFKNKTNE
jgi:hypothetical protein